MEYWTYLSVRERGDKKSCAAAVEILKYSLMSQETSISMSERDREDDETEGVHEDWWLHV